MADHSTIFDDDGVLPPAGRSAFHDLLSDYFYRPVTPPFIKAFGDVSQVAAARGWAVPSQDEAREMLYADKDRAACRTSFAYRDGLVR